MTRQITCVAVDLTTVCDRACPDCCCGINMNMRPAVHHPWEYFEKLAPFIYGIERVDLFGGEPTTHPKFAEFVPKFKALWGCKVLSMTTDGFKVIRHQAVLEHFDFIQATLYDNRNRPAIEFLQANYDTRLFPGVFTPRARIGGGKPCGRGQGETVAFADGKFWPCTPGPGITGNVGLEPCMDWREKILSVPMACASCFLSL